MDFLTNLNPKEVVYLASPLNNRLKANPKLLASLISRSPLDCLDRNKLQVLVFSHNRNPKHPKVVDFSLTKELHRGNRQCLLGKVNPKLEVYLHLNLRQGFFLPLKLHNNLLCFLNQLNQLSLPNSLLCFHRQSNNLTLFSTNNPMHPNPLRDNNKLQL